MKDSQTTYHNLQEYLEASFKDTATVTDAMLKEAKQKWRKIYLSRYHKGYRDKYIQISFRLAKKDYDRITKLAKEENLTVTSYIKRIILQHNTSHTTQLTTIPLLEAIDYIEEALYEDTPIDADHLLSLLEQCHDR